MFLVHVRIIYMAGLVIAAKKLVQDQKNDVLDN